MACETNAQSQGRVELKVNGESIELNSFVEAMFKETILGMLRPLRGVGDIQSVNLEIAR